MGSERSRVRAARLARVGMLVAAAAAALGTFAPPAALAADPSPRAQESKADRVDELLRKRDDAAGLEQQEQDREEQARKAQEESGRGAPKASPRPGKPRFREDMSTDYMPGNPDSSSAPAPAPTLPGAPPAAEMAPGSSGPQASASPAVQVSRDVITELILDASGSMKQKIQQRTKLFQAKRVLRSFMLESQADNMVLGLRVYGLKERDCKNTKLVLDFGEKGAEAVDGAMEKVDPKGYGKTPLALSLTDAAKDLTRYPGKPRRIIVVTDGVETCGGDPCKIAKKLKRDFDIRIFVVGYTLSDDEREKLKCLADFTGGKFWDANDLSSLLDALKDLSNKDKNLFVKSPDPTGLSELWLVEKGKPKRKVAEFVSSIGVRAEPGLEYEVVVKLAPAYRFKHVVLERNEKRTLEVKGDGEVNIRFMDGLFTVSLLNDQGKPVMTFPSDKPVKVPCGYYKVRAVSPPFADTLIDDVRVVPNGHYAEGIKGFGSLEIDADKDRGPGPFGYYVFDDVKKSDIGSYLTGLPLVLPIGRYTVKTVGNSILKNVYPETNAIRKIPMPPPGQTVTFARRKDDKSKDNEGEGDGKKAPTMLDSLTPEQIQKHLEEKEKQGL